MINHRAIRLALRAQLLTLSVASTGSTTLEATATGYARPAGSFLDDGFAPGMEVTPSGFTQTTRSVITEVSALSLTVQGGRTAQAAAAGRTLSVGLPASRALENVVFDPTPGVPYMVEEYVPGPTRKITLGAFGEVEGLPMYAVQIHVRAGLGMEAADRYADELLNLFAPGTSLPIAGGALWVRGDTGPYRGQLLQSSPGFAVVPVNVPLRLRTPNSI